MKSIRCAWFMSFHALGAAADALGAALVAAPAESVGIAEDDGMAEPVSAGGVVAGGGVLPPHAAIATAGAAHAITKAIRKIVVVVVIRSPEMRRSKPPF
jgi:hypothetical protein